jgi:histidine triad (HIT) family protein
MATEEGCIFCDIIKGKIKSWKVYQDKYATAFLDINPRNPGHTIVVSNNHYDTIMNLPEGEGGPVFEAVRKVSIAIVNGTDADGVSIAQSSGASSGNLIKHFHFHIIPRFSNEDAVSIEGILPVKKATDAEKNGMVKKITSKIPKK